MNLNDKAKGIILNGDILYQKVEDCEDEGVYKIQMVVRRPKHKSPAKRCRNERRKREFLSQFEDPVPLPDPILLAPPVGLTPEQKIQFLVEEKALLERKSKLMKEVVYWEERKLQIRQEVQEEELARRLQRVTLLEQVASVPVPAHPTAPPSKKKKKKKKVHWK